MNSKGMSPMVVVMVLILVFLGFSLFVPLITKANLTNMVDYSTDDVNTVASTKVREENYIANMEKELNYSYNNVAYRLAENSNLMTDDLYWDRAYEKSEIKEEFLDQVWSHDLGFDGQMRVRACEKPGLEESQLGLEYGSTANGYPYALNVTMDIRDDQSIKCSGKASTAEVFLSQDEVKARPANNTFLTIMFLSSDLVKESQDVIDNKVSWVKHTASDLDCTESVAEDNANQTAWDNAMPTPETLAEETRDNLDIPTFLEVEPETEIKVSNWNVREDTTQDPDCGTCDPGPCPAWNKYEEEWAVRVDKVKVSWGIEDTEHTIITNEGMDKELDYYLEYEETGP